MNTTKKTPTLAISLLIGLVLSAFFLIGLFSNINLKLTDNLYGESSALDDIAIIAIDDPSLQEIGRWSWDRKIIATLLSKLHEASVVAIDIGFYEQSNEESDTRLANAISELGNVVLPVEYTSFKQGKSKVIGDEILLQIPQVYRAAKSFGYINVLTDLDGVTRAVNMQLSQDYESFAHAIYKEHTGKEFKFNENRFLVNFVGRPGSFTTYSAKDVLNNDVDETEFKGKIILIGATSPDLHDDYFVPTSQGKAMPGVEFHANTIQTMMTGKVLIPITKGITILIIILTGLTFGFIAHKLKVWMSAGIAIVSIIIYAFIAIIVFEKNIVLNIVYVPLSIILSYIGVISYSYFFEQKEKRKIMNAFGKYVSEDVITDMLKNPDKLKLGGEKTRITIFFSDIRGFTTISEALGPEKLVHLLNEYLSEMTDIILKNKGLVDKFMGDAIMAFWGAPVKIPDHAKMAARTTLEMNKRLEELQEKWTKEGVPALKIGAGLNTGEAIVGNMGSYNRFDYTAMGDTINLGSRLEGITKGYGVVTIVSEFTREDIHDEFLCRKLDAVQVKGKTKPVIIYELVDEKKNVSESKNKIVAHFEKGLALYWKKKWNDAIKEFEKALSIGQDRPAEVFIERCKVFKKNPPPAKWDGVWVMKTK